MEHVHHVRDRIGLKANLIPFLASFPIRGRRAIRLLAARASGRTPHVTRSPHVTCQSPPSSMTPSRICPGEQYRHSEWSAFLNYRCLKLLPGRVARTTACPPWCCNPSWFQIGLRRRYSHPLSRIHLDGKGIIVFWAVSGPHNEDQLNAPVTPGLYSGRLFVSEIVEIREEESEFYLLTIRAPTRTHVKSFFRTGPTPAWLVILEFCCQPSVVCGMLHWEKFLYQRVEDLPFCTRSPNCRGSFGSTRKNSTRF